MSDSMILLGAIAIGVERWTELWMNLLKMWFPSLKTSDEIQRIILRGSALTFGILSGLVICGVNHIDIISGVLPSSNISNRWILTGILIGLGASPAHEVIKYIEEKKNQAKSQNASS